MGALTVLGDETESRSADVTCRGPRRAIEIGPITQFGELVYVRGLGLRQFNLSDSKNMPKGLCKLYGRVRRLAATDVLVLWVVGRLTTRPF